MTDIDKSRVEQIARISNDDVEAQVDANDLRYNYPKDLTVVESRNYVRVVSDTASAKANNTIQFRWNTGNSYVHPLNSYLKLKVRTSAGTPDFGTGSVANLIKEVVVLSNSGQEVDRITNFNVWHRDWVRYSTPVDYQSNILSTAYYNESSSKLSTADQTLCLPLSHLAGIFNRDKLMPAHLAAGLVVQITFDTDIRAWNVAGSFTASSMELVLDVYHLKPVVLRKLDAISASNGLEYWYESYHTSKYTTSASQFDADIAKAVSRAQMAWAKVQQSDQINEATEDAFLSDDSSNYVSAQWRLGSLYFPMKALDSEQEMYMFTQHAFDKLRDSNTHNNVTFSTYSSNGAVLGVSLEKSTVLGLSGLPMNNSRRLNLSMTFGGGVDREIYIFLKFVRVASIYLDRVKISE
jgi:hypothetical protein